MIAYQTAKQNVDRILGTYFATEKPLCDYHIPDYNSQTFSISCNLFIVYGLEFFYPGTHWNHPKKECFFQPAYSKRSDGMCMLHRLKE